MKAELRAAVQEPWVNAALQDVRYAARAVRHSRRFALWVIGSLAVGMAAAIAAFAFLIASSWAAWRWQPAACRPGERCASLQSARCVPNRFEWGLSGPYKRCARQLMTHRPDGRSHSRDFSFEGRSVPVQ
jgi:hypothetical protein